MTIAGRRRRSRVNASIAAIVALAVGIPVTIVAMTAHGTPTANQADQTWRWESYRGAQVQVPPNWEDGRPRQTWCAGAKDSRVRPGVVGRPMPVAAVGCATRTESPPPMRLRENWLTFDDRNKVAERRFDHGWVEETRRVNGVFITVFTNDDALRAAIFDSAEPIVDADRYDCPADPPVVADPAGYRPDVHGGLPPAGTVRSISVCRYALASDPASPLLSSSRVTGVDAKEIVNAIRSAPEGEGPDVENGRGGRGTEIALLRIDTTGGIREVVMRYSGETGNGFDDGTTKHRLTADSIRPLLTGANSPRQFFPPVAQLLSS